MAESDRQISRKRAKSQGEMEKLQEEISQLNKKIRKLQEERQKATDADASDSSNE
ncbi:uncharacterized protein LOC113464850 isoform X2 [Ceratina calcarata]|uniref:Uncharacterized protein LOC113464850 isoform X2 n=1 Tax=Ceratina calcarata TaxID=156304 RepID=A0AAJ7WF24_9HYME|nr:uncharacterized protein LOC113464850 isoform X2 [Ceratina calcarata]